MAVKKRIKFNVDKLKECYRQPVGFFEALSQYPNNKYLEYDGFKLHIIDNGRYENSDKPPIRIKANVLLDDGTLVGDFVFHASAQYDGRCFFTFANAALYEQTNLVRGEKYNHQSDIEYISSVLGLELNNFTEIELAADVNFNIIAKIQRFIKDYEDFDMILNGKRVSDENRKLEGVGEYYGRSRAKRDKYPTLYFKQANVDGLQLKIYDKTKEIIEENPTKKYIEEWNDFGSAHIYRIELTIRNDHFKKWLDAIRSGEVGVLREWGDFDASEGLLMLGAYKCPLWDFNASKVLYFRHRATSEVVSLLDIALGAWG